jgi:hypothetical protein
MSEPGFEVAAAYVTVTPDVSDFAAALDEALGGLQLSVVVTPDVSDFAAAVDEALGGLTVSVAVIPDASDFAAAVDEQVGGLSVSVAVTPDASDFEASLLEQAGGITVPVTVAPEAAGIGDLGDLVGEQTGTVALPVTAVPDAAGFEEALGEVTAGITVSVRTVPDASDFQEQLDDQVGTPVVGVSLQPALANLAEHIGDSLAGAIPVPVVPDMGGFADAVAEQAGDITVPVIPDVGDFADALAEESGGITVQVDVVPSPESLDALPARIEEGAGGLQITADVVPVLGDISSALEDQASAGAVAIPVTADIEPLEEQLAEARDLVGDLAGQVYALELTADDDDAVSVLGSLKDELLSVTGTVYSVSVSAEDLEEAQSALAGISEQLAGVQQEAQAAAGPAAALGEALQSAGDVSGLQADTAALGDVQEAASAAAQQVDEFRQLTADAFGSVDYSAATAALNGVAAAAGQDAELIEEDFAGIEDRLASVSAAVSALDADFLRMANADFSYATDAELADMTSAFENLYGELESVQSEFAGLQAQLSAAGGEFEGMDAGLGSVSSALAGVEGSLEATSAQLQATAGSWYDEEAAAQQLGVTMEELPGALAAVDAQLTASMQAREASVAALNGETGAMETLTEAAPAAADAAGGLSGVLGELAGRMSYMAVDPFMWMLAAPLVIDAVTIALKSVDSASASLVQQLTAQDDATGYNISGYQKLIGQLGSAASGYEKAAQANEGYTTAIGHGTSESEYQVAQYDALSAAQQQQVTSLDNLTGHLGTLSDTYGLTQQQAETLAQAVKVSASTLEGSGTAADGAMAKIEAYANANINATGAVNQMAGDMDTFGNDALTASTRVSALDNAYNILVGNFVSTQQDSLQVAADFLTIGSNAQQAGASMTGTNQASVTLQQSFFATMGAIEQTANAMTQQGSTTKQVTGYINDQISKLSGLTGGSQAAQQAVSGLKQWEDNLTESTKDAYGAINTAADALADNFSKQLTTAGVNAKTAKTDVDNLTTSILNNGSQSTATQNDRAQLITDLENAGMNATAAKTDVDNFITSIGKIPKQVSLQITENATGTVSITAPGTAAVQGGGREVAPGTGGLAGGGLITGGSGHPRADDIHAMLSHGEYVVSAGAVSKYGTGFLDSVNAGHFADGGYTGSLSGLGGWVDSQYTGLVVSLAGALEEALQSSMASAAAAAGGKSPVSVNFYGTQYPTAEQQQALMTQLSAVVGVS